MVNSVAVNNQKEHALPFMVSSVGAGIGAGIGACVGEALEKAFDLPHGTARHGLGLAFGFASGLLSVSGDTMAHAIYNTSASAIKTLEEARARISRSAIAVGLIVGTAVGAGIASRGMDAEKPIDPLLVGHVYSMSSSAVNPNPSNCRTMSGNDTQGGLTVRVLDCH